MKEISDLRIQHLKHDDCIRYKDTLISFYYRNSVTCSSLSHFSKADAEAKINSMMDHISDGSAIVFGAITGDKLVGYIWSYEYTFREEARIYVSEIHVDESYRNRGIGKQLLRAVETAARDGGYGALYLHTEGSNKDAIKLYEKEGYIIERVQLRKGL